MKRPDSTRVAVLGVLMVVSLATGWVMSGVLVKGVPPMTVAAGRTIGAFLTLALIAAARPRAWPALRSGARRWQAVVWLAVLGFLTYYSGTLIAVMLIGASRTNVVVSLLPCLTVVIGAAWFAQRPTARQSAGSVVAVAAATGYGLMTSTGMAGSATGQWTGIWLALAGTACYAAYGFVYKARFSDLAPADALPAITFAAMVMLVPVALVANGSDWGSISAANWLGVLVLGAVFTAPVFIVSHELIVRRGPLFTSAIALVVPFLVRLAEWRLGSTAAPGLADVGLLLACTAGIWLTVSSPQTVSERELEKSHA